MIHPNYFLPPLDHHHPRAPLSYQHHQYLSRYQHLSLSSHYPSSLRPRQGRLCKWTQPMYHYHLRQREPQMTSYGYPQMPPPSTSHHSSFICNLLNNSTTVKLSEESLLAQSTARYASPSQLCSTYPFPLMLIPDPPPLWTPSAKDVATMQGEFNDKSSKVSTARAKGCELCERALSWLGKHTLILMYLPV